MLEGALNEGWVLMPTQTQEIPPLSNTITAVIIHSRSQASLAGEEGLLVQAVVRQLGGVQIFRTCGSAFSKCNTSSSIYHIKA